MVLHRGHVHDCNYRSEVNQYMTVDQFTGFEVDKSDPQWIICKLCNGVGGYDKNEKGMSKELENALQKHFNNGGDSEESFRAGWVAARGEG